jgi:hypothetical protein
MKLIALQNVSSATGANHAIVDILQFGLNAYARNSLSQRSCAWLDDLWSLAIRRNSEDWRRTFSEKLYSTPLAWVRITKSRLIVKRAGHQV